MKTGRRGIKQGYFRPKNPTKYKGNPNNIFYRSSWEFTVMSKLDENPLVLWWASEELSIPYYCPVEKRQRLYYPDFIVSRKSATTGQINTFMIEVKPLAQTREPVKPDTKDRRKLRRFIRETFVYKNNIAKWAAAEEFCSAKGWTFTTLTEKQLGII